jgi:hypothetical protein
MLLLLKLGRAKQSAVHAGSSHDQKIVVHCFAEICLLVCKVLYIIATVFYFFVSICWCSEVFVAGCVDVLVSSSKMWLFPF